MEVRGNPLKEGSLVGVAGWRSLGDVLLIFSYVLKEQHVYSEDFFNFCMT